MYKVAVLVNENEMAHSAFANTPKLLSEVQSLQGRDEDNYNFEIFDKFNIASLFKKNESNYLLSFDSLFISTNATNNSEILDALRSNRPLLDEFISLGKGVFVSSQKKLSCKEGHQIEEVSFFPDRYDYAIVDRPEKSSAEGVITIAHTAEKHVLCSYPNHIDNSIIKSRCENNSFMHHNYRSFIIPRDEGQYTTILCDSSTATVPPALTNSIDKSRKLLLCSGKDTERVVISTMALDWAEHKELIENILLYITEGVPIFAFVIKKDEIDSGALKSYIIRAKVQKMSYRYYTDTTHDSLIDSLHSIFVFSPEYNENDVAEFISEANKTHRNVSVYHLINAANDSDGFALYHYTNETSVTRIKTEANNWLTRKFYPKLWGKSVWTYNYVLSAMKKTGVSVASFVPQLYNELQQHFCKHDVVDGSYDNVINATCNMVEVLKTIEPHKDKALGKHPLPEVLGKAQEWLAQTLLTPRCGLYDKLYVFESLYRTSYIYQKNKEEKKKLHEAALEVIRAHEAEGFETRSNLALCQILYILKQLVNEKIFPKNQATEYCQRIDSIIFKRQDEFGQFGNISETAEVVFRLLELEDKRREALFKVSDSIAITRAIEQLLRTYDATSCSWYNDINTTAKALHAICLYDMVLNNHSNDFFNDISTEYSRLSTIHSIENATENYHTNLDALQEKEQIIKRIEGENNKLKLFKKLFFYAIVITGVLIVLMVLILASIANETIEFEGKTISVIKKVFLNWQSEFIYGFICIVAGAAFSWIFSKIKKWLNK